MKINNQEAVDFLNSAKSKCSSDNVYMDNPKAIELVQKLEKIMQSNGLSLYQYFSHIEDVINVHDETQRLEQLRSTYPIQSSFEIAENQLLSLRPFLDQNYVITNGNGMYDLMPLSYYYNAVSNTLEHFRITKSKMQDEYKFLKQVRKEMFPFITLKDESAKNIVDYLKLIMANNGLSLNKYLDSINDIVDTKQETKRLLNILDRYNNLFDPDNIEFANAIKRQLYKLSKFRNESHVRFKKDVTYHLLTLADFKNAVDITLKQIEQTSFII